jgi:hypothetical protein
MNKWLLACSCCLLAYLFAVPFRVEAMTVGQLTEVCSEPADTILQKGFSEVTSGEFRERHIRVFAFTTPSPAGAYFAVDISNTDQMNAEIPHFKHICYQNMHKPPSMSANGDITLHGPADTARNSRRAPILAQELKAPSPALLS